MVVLLQSGLKVKEVAAKMGLSMTAIRDTVRNRTGKKMSELRSEKR